MNVWEFELIPILREIIIELQEHHEKTCSTGMYFNFGSFCSQICIYFYLR